VVGVEQWAEIRRMYFVGRLSIKEIVRRSGHSRNTIRRALRSGEPPRYRRPPRPSKLDPFREEIHRLLRSDARLPGKRMRELLEEQGYVGGKTILDDYLREVRPLFLRQRTFQRTSYRPGVLCQFDLWQASREIPVGSGQTRRGYVVVGCLPYSRAGAGTLVFSKEAPDLLYGIGACLTKLGALPETLVWDREGALHAGEGRPTDPFAAFCGELRVGWRFLEPRDPQSKGVVERLQDYLGGVSSRAARSPPRSTSRSSSTAGSASAPTCVSTARSAADRRIGWPRSWR
jgi:transposase